MPFLNPGSNTAQESKLRLINPGSGDASIEITGWTMTAGLLVR